MATMAATVTATVTANTVLTLYDSVNGQPTATTLQILVAATGFQSPNIVLGYITSIVGSVTSYAQVTLGQPMAVAMTTATSQTASPSNPGQTRVPTGPPSSSTGFPPASSSPASPASPASKTPDQSQPSSGIGGGVVAGVAIGCLLAGALLGFLIAFFWSRRRRSNETDDYASTSVAIVAEPKGYGAPLPLPPPADKLQLDRFLLDSTSDSQVASDLRSVGTVIQLHVENNYHLGPVGVEGHTLNVALAQLGVQTGGSLGPSELASLALAPATRQAALQHVISQVVLTSIDVSARSQLSMLPTPIAAFLQSIPPRENGNQADITSIALNKWRALSAFLLHPARSQRTSLPISEAAVASKAAALADALNTFLYYFVADNEAARFQQKGNLEDVIIEAAKLGYMVLSQPSEWRFVHTPGSRGGDRVAVLCAGLVKVTHRDGTPYSTPKQVLAPTFARV